MSVPMAQVVENLSSFGNPGDGGEIGVSLGGITSKLYFNVQCPGQRSHESAHHIVKNGHNTSVKGHPQQYLCETCGASFYAHTSRFFHKLFGELKRLLKRALRGGRLDLKQLAARFDLSRSAASRLLAVILRHLHSLGKLERYKELPRDEKVIFSHKTFLTIQGEQWYIVAFRNEQGKVLYAFLTRHRSADVLLPHFRKAIRRMRRGVELLVTDDFAAYQAVVLALETNITHVRCVHKPPHGRIVIDFMTWEGKVAHYTTAATISDVLKARNTFLARVNKHDKRQKVPGTKRGHPKGTKNRPKEVIAAEKAEKAKPEGINPKNRGRKNSSRQREVHVFHYNLGAGKVDTWRGSEQIIDPDQENGNKRYNTVSPREISNWMASS